MNTSQTGIEWIIIKPDSCNDKVEFLFIDHSSGKKLVGIVFTVDEAIEISNGILKVCGRNHS